jgi:hypothetical protein
MAVVMSSSPSVAAECPSVPEVIAVLKELVKGLGTLIRSLQVSDSSFVSGFYGRDLGDFFSVWSTVNSHKRNVNPLEFSVLSKNARNLLEKDCPTESEFNKGAVKMMIQSFILILKPFHVDEDDMSTVNGL